MNHTDQPMNHTDQREAFLIGILVNGKGAFHEEQDALRRTNTVVIPALERLRKSETELLNTLKELLSITEDLLPSNLCEECFEQAGDKVEKKWKAIAKKVKDLTGE